MTSFGLDIGTNQVKALQASRTTGGFKLGAMAVANLDGANQAAAIKQAVKEAGIKPTAEVNVALAESELYTRIIETPRLSEAELAASIQYEAEQNIPVSLDEVELHHQILTTETDPQEQKMKVLLIAVSKTKIEGLMQLFEQAELIPKSIEPELFALKRIVSDETKAQILACLGHKTSDILIVNHGLPVFTHSINLGGLALTKSLMNELGLSTEQAEEYKKTYGLRSDLLEGKIAKILEPLIDELLNQLKKALVFSQQQGLGRAPEELILAGGGALLPGLSGYLAEKLGLEVVVADPFKNFVKDKEFNKKLTSKTNPQLATVVGLAVKNL